MIPADDVHGQILAALYQYVGIPPSDMTPEIYGTICAIIMAFPSVASVGLHYGNVHAAGRVDASVELNDGEVIAIHITEPGCDGDDYGHLHDRIDGLESTVGTLEARLTGLEQSHARLIVKVAALEVQAAYSLIRRHPWLSPEPGSMNYPTTTTYAAGADTIGKHTV
jgi:hypothetical protein